MVYFITGIPGTGKTTLANLLYDKLLSESPDNPPVKLDGDVLRLMWKVGYDQKGRTTNVLRATMLAKMFSESGSDVIISMVAPYTEQRKIIREATDAREIYLNEIFEQRPDSYYNFKYEEDVSEVFLVGMQHAMTYFKLRLR